MVYAHVGQIVDAVIMPVAPHAAVIPGKYYHTAYTEAINLMSYSAAVIPVTFADKTLDPYDKSYQPRGEVDALNWEACKLTSFHPINERAVFPVKGSRRANIKRALKMTPKFTMGPLLGCRLSQGGMRKKKSGPLLRLSVRFCSQHKRRWS